MQQNLPPKFDDVSEEDRALASFLPPRRLARRFLQLYCNFVSSRRDDDDDDAAAGPFFGPCGLVQS